MLFTTLAAVFLLAAPAFGYEQKNATVRPSGYPNTCLTATGTAKGSPVTLAKCAKGDRSQEWKMSSSTTYLRLTGTEWCASVGTVFTEGQFAPSDGHSIVLATCPTQGYAAPHAWFTGKTFIYGGAETSKPDGVFTMVSAGYDGGDRYCLDNTGGAGTGVQLWHCYENNCNQKWSVSLWS